MCSRRSKRGWREAYRAADVTAASSILAPGSAPLKDGENGKGILSRWYPDTLKKRILDIDTTRERIRRDSGFTFAELDAGHDVMVTAPSLLTEKLLATAG